MWDSEENLKAIRDRVCLLLKGCKCLTGCQTARCACKKNNRKCSEGCQCHNCANITVTMDHSNLADVAIQELDITTVDDNETDELMDYVFGDDLVHYANSDKEYS